MSRDPYSAQQNGRSPRPTRRDYRDEKGRNDVRSSPSYGRGHANSPLQNDLTNHSHYLEADNEISPMDSMERRGPGGGVNAASSSHHRSRSVTRSGGGGMGRAYHSLDRDNHDRDREFLPIRDPRDRDPRDIRERSMDRGMDGMVRRERSMDRGAVMDEEMMYRDGPPSANYGMSRSARQSPAVDLGIKAGMLPPGRDGFLMDLQSQNSELSRELANLKKELELTNQKLSSSMHSIKTFWSPELKKERALRKEESAKYSLISDQLKLLNSENQKQALLVRQLEEELRLRSLQGPSMEIRQQMESLYAENEHLTREVAILRDTVKELELRIETQKQTLQARDESIKKLLEMLQTKGVGKEEERLMLQQMQTLAQKQIEELRGEVTKRDQELLGVGAKMKTLEEQLQDYQRHIAVLKESLCAKEEHYNMLQTDVEELRQRLEEKNRLIEKKTQTALQATQERNRFSNELNEIRDHMEIKDRKINVLQRKLDLQEASRKSATTNHVSPDLKKQLDDQKRALDEQKSSLEQRQRLLDEKQKQLEELDKKMKKRHEELMHMEEKARTISPQGSSGDSSALQEEVLKLREESQRAAEEAEKLMKLVQMSQEEQFARDKTIAELQEALRIERARRTPRSNSATPSSEAQNRTQEADDYLEEIRREIDECHAESVRLQRDCESRIDYLETEVDRLNNELKHKEEALTRKQMTIDSLDGALKEVKEELMKKEEEVKAIMCDVKEKESVINGKMKRVRHESGMIADAFKEQAEKLRLNLEDCRLQLKQKDHRIHELEILLKAKEDLCAKLESNIEAVLNIEQQATDSDLVKELKGDLKVKDSVIDDLRHEVANANLLIQELRVEHKLKDTNVDELRANCDKLTLELSNCKKVIQDKDVIMTKMEVEIRRRTMKENEVECNLTAKEVEIRALRSELLYTVGELRQIIELGHSIAVCDSTSQSDIEELQKAITDLRLELDQKNELIRNLKVEYDAKNSAKLQKDAEFINLSAELDSKKCDLKTANKKLEIVTASLADLRVELELKDELTNTLRAELEGKQAICEPSADNFHEELYLKEQTLLSTKTELDVTKARLNERTEKLKEVNMKLEFIQLENERKEEMVKTVQAEFEKQKNEVTRMHEKLQEVTLNIANLQVELNTKDEMLRSLKLELDVKRKEIIEFNSFNPLDNKNKERIEELEEALRESVRITAQQELILDDARREKNNLQEQVLHLQEQLDEAEDEKEGSCRFCSASKKRLHDIEAKLSRLLAERRSHLHELFDMKQEALEAAISEKDAQLALLEVSGIKTAKAAEQADVLRSDRKRLTEQMRLQNEKRMKLIQEYDDPSLGCRLSAVIEDAMNSNG